MSPTILIVLSVGLGVAGQLLLKSGLGRTGPLSLETSGLFRVVWSVATNPRISAGLAVYGIGTFFWLAALSQVELSYAYPFISLSYVLILLASWALFKEDISLLKMLGVVAICFGVFWVAGS